MVAGFDLGVFGEGFIIEGDEVLGEGELDLGAAEVGEVLGEEFIDALGGGVGWDGVVEGCWGWWIFWVHL